MEDRKIYEYFFESHLEFIQACVNSGDKTAFEQAFYDFLDGLDQENELDEYQVDLSVEDARLYFSTHKTAKICGLDILL